MTRYIVIMLSIVVYGFALFTPTIVFDQPDDYYVGIYCLVLGWVGMTIIPWLANPIFFACLICLWLKSCRIALILGSVAIVLASCTLLYRQMMHDEAGNMRSVTGYGPGFYLWLASFIIPTAASLAPTVYSRRRS
jgi:hypothetical protein